VSLYSESTPERPIMCCLHYCTGSRQKCLKQSSKDRDDENVPRSGLCDKLFIVS